MRRQQHLCSSRDAYKSAASMATDKSTLLLPVAIKSTILHASVLLVQVVIAITIRLLFSKELILHYSCMGVSTMFMIINFPHCCPGNSTCDALYSKSSYQAINATASMRNSK